MNNVIANKYQLIEKINEGIFGTVYKAINRRTKEFIAIKFEDKSNNTKSLKNEAKIYQYLGNINGFPQLKYFGTTSNMNYLVTELLGKSLQSFLFQKISPNIVSNIGIQMITRIEALHNKYMLHRDIKPSNFVFGINNETNKLYLIDFGFSKRYNYNGKHIEEKHIHHIIGTPNFVSLNVHNHIEPSRRDDLESCIYIILAILIGNLEWFSKQKMDEIVFLKEKVIEQNIPPCIKNMLVYVRNLTFTEKPNYHYLCELLLHLS
jgi:serine/threonine protein kinase